jgi:amino acid adenylation domain-containing protein
VSAVEPEIEGYQLSPQQQAVYLQGGAEGRATCRVRSGTVVTPRELAARMEALVARHEVLRTRYLQVAGLRLPVQVINPAASVSAGERPGGGTVLRAGELTIECSDTPDGTVLLLGLPRLSVDRPSWSMLTGYLLGEPAETALVPDQEQALQYADVAAWLAEELERPRPAGSPAETREPPAAIPFLMPASRWQADAEPEAVSATVEGPALNRLRAVARELGLSEAALLLAAWRSLYGRYTRNAGDQLVVVTSGRSASGLNGLLGLLERPVAVDLPVVMGAPFAQAALAAADALKAAEAEECHSDPGTFLRTREGRDPGPAISFRYQWDRWAAVTEPGLPGSPELPGVLHLDCVAEPQKLSLTMASTGARVARADLASYARAFEHLLADAIADPGRPAGVLRMDSPAEPTAGSQRRYETVLHRFLAHADRLPGRPAVRSRDEVLTYRDLAQRAGAVGVLLRARGVQAGAHVPVLAEATAGTLAAMLGTWLAGAVFVAVDPAWPEPRIEAILRQLGPALILVPKTAAGISFPVPAVPLPDQADVASGPAPAAPPVQGPAYVIFTSGTSGSPKGVVTGHRQLAHYAEAILRQLRLPDGAGFAAVSTLAADLSYTAIFPTLASGGCVHLLDRDIATNPDALAGWFRANPVSAMKLVPSHLSALLAEASDQMALLPGEVLVLGGEIFPRSLHDQLRQLAPRLRLYNHYGPAETTIGASCLALDAPVDERCASVPVGAGLGGDMLSVADEEGNPLPPWCPGEVLISGPGVGLGYLAELRQGRSGFGEHVSQYRSGDLGRLVPGSGVEIIGRLDDQVKLRGHRVQLSEIELVLQRQPGVAAAAVVARRDENGLVSHLDAYVVCRDNGAAGAPSAGNLQAALGRELPAPLVPTGWQLLERLPLTPNGKLDRQALVPVTPQRMQAGRPRDSVEQRLLVLWTEVLGIDDISPADDFFDLGGHSLHALRLISRANRDFGCGLPISAVFTARTVAAMADMVRDRHPQDSNLVPLRRGKGGAPVFCFHPGGGSTLSYLEFARLLPADHRVMGVEAAGLHGMQPHETFTAMAEAYAAAIAASSDKPPVFAGWCFGGLVARETAEAMRCAGHEVAMLILVDCPAPGFNDEDDEALQEARLVSESALISRFASHFEPGAPAPSPASLTAYQLKLKAMQSSGHLPSAASDDELRTVVEVYTSNMTAWERHFGPGSPEYPVPGYPVTLIRAEPGETPADQDRTWGWGSLIGPGLSFISVAADHHSIMRPPAVADLAASVVRALGGER